MYRGTLGNLAPLAGVLDQGHTVTNSVGSLSALNAATTHVLVSVDTQSIRVTFDDSDPSGTNGHCWAAGYENVLTRAEAAAMKFYRAGGSDGYLHASQLSR